MPDLIEKLQTLKKFVLHDVWSIELAGASGKRGFASRAIRIGHLIIRGYQEDDLPVRASALTFSFLMSLVPLLAIASALLKGLGADKGAIAKLLDFGETLPKEGQIFVENVIAIVDKTNFVALGWIGVLVLFVTAVQVLATIEDTFNKIWGVTKRRSWWQRFTNYTSITIVVPVLVAAAFALSASARAGAMDQLDPFGFVRNLLKLLPLFTTWLAFSVLFKFMPNTRVEKRASFTAAFVTALLWLGWQKLYILFQFGIAKYNAIYGTFASIPVFLFWMFICWTIILLGAEFCFALQNQSTYHLERVAQSASVEARLTLALGLLAEAAEKFAGGSTTFSAEQFGHSRKLPSRLVNDTTRQLCRGGYLVEIADSEGLFALNRTPDKILISEIWQFILGDGTAPGPLGLTRNVHPAVDRALASCEQGAASALAGKTLAQLVA